MSIRVPPRLRVAAAAAVAIAALTAMVVLVVAIRAGESGTGRLPFASTRAAPPPFEAFSQARVAVGERCLRVLVATTPAQRVQGLRDVRSLAPYDGMLFVNPSETRAAYTMAGTPLPLDITFFAASGEPVGGARMEPCPNGTDATCPRYESDAPYRYALERPAGAAAPAGALAGCGA